MGICTRLPWRRKAHRRTIIVDKAGKLKNLSYPQRENSTTPIRDGLGIWRFRQLSSLMSPAAFLPLEPLLNSNCPILKKQIKTQKKPPFQAVFLRKVVGVRELRPRAPAPKLMYKPSNGTFCGLSIPFRWGSTSFAALFHPLFPYISLGVWVRVWVKRNLPL